MTASKLRAPGDEEQEKFLQEVYVTEASTGGNGIRRPYGLFIATRNGNGKSLWTRLPAPRSRNYSVPAPPPATSEGLRGKNVSQFNVGRGEYTKRNMSLDRKKIRSSYGFKGEDTVRRCKMEINTPREDRPFWDATAAIRGHQWGDRSTPPPGTNARCLRRGRGGGGAAQPGLLLPGCHLSHRSSRRALGRPRGLWRRHRHPAHAPRVPRPPGFPPRHPRLSQRPAGLPRRPAASSAVAAARASTAGAQPRRSARPPRHCHNLT